MVSVSIVFAVMLFGATLAQAQKINASAYCFQCSQRRNHKDAYPDPTGDCHSFYKCQYVNDTYAIGTKLSCPVGTYWHDEVLVCLPEGPVPCSDSCQIPNVQARGCYALTGNCASYFVCSGTASYALCCPPKTRFNSANCQCEASETCKDTCVIKHHPPTIETPPQNFTTFCIDSYRNILRPTNDSSVFLIVDGEWTHSVNCVAGTVFSLLTCRCEGEVVPETIPPNRQCSLYLPFDSDTNDHSNSRFWTELVQPASVDNAVYAQGAGSLAVSGGHLEVPGTKNLDFYHDFGVCLFYRCRSSASASCAGGLFSNNKDRRGSELNIIIAAIGLKEFIFIDKSVNGVGADQATVDAATNAASGFTQICASFNKTHALLYVNKVSKFLPVQIAPLALGASRSTGQFVGAVPRPPRANFAYAHCPTVIGTDQIYGDYHGWIDEVLVCPFGITASDVGAHWNGRSAMAKVGLVPA